MRSRTSRSRTRRSRTSSTVSSPASSWVRPQTRWRRDEHDRDLQSAAARGVPADGPVPDPVAAVDAVRDHPAGHLPRGLGRGRDVPGRLGLRIHGRRLRRVLRDPHVREPALDGLELPRVRMGGEPGPSGREASAAAAPAALRRGGQHRVQADDAAGARPHPHRRIDHVRRAVRDPAVARPGVHPERHPRVRAPFHLRLDRRLARVLGDAHEHGEHALAARRDRVRGPERADRPHAGLAAGAVVRPFVLVHAGRAHRDPAGRGHARARGAHHRRTGRVACGLLRRLPAHLEARRPGVLGGGRVIRYVRIVRTFVTAEMQTELAYRLNFVLGILEMVLVIGTSIGAVLVLFTQTSSLNGWSLPQMIALTGVYYLVQGGVNLVFSPSFEKLMEHVRQGTLDFTLLKPANTQFLVSTRHFRLVRLVDFLFGMGVVVVGLLMLGDAVTPWSALAFLVTLACGIACVYTLLLTLVTLAFWFVRVDNILAIFWAFTDAGRFPIDLYPGWLRLTLATIVPIGIAVTVPAEAISGRMSLETFAGMLAGTAFSVTFASWFWRRGLRSYTGARP